MTLNKEALRAQARYIRDVLGPLIGREGGEALSAEAVADLRVFLEDLGEMDMTMETIQYSRIEKAIMEMCGPGTRWPKDLIARAEAVMNRWEGSLGPLKRVRTNLWGPGGRLQSVSKIVLRPAPVLEDQRGQKCRLMSRAKEHKSSWSVEGGCDPARAYVAGHNGFDVGQ